MPSKINLTPEKKAQLKKDVLDGITSGSTNLNKPVFRPTLKVKKELPIIQMADSVSKKSISKPSKVIMSDEKFKMVKKSKVKVKKVLKTEKTATPKLAIVKTFNKKAIKPIKKKITSNLVDVPVVAPVDDFFEKTEEKPKINPLIERMRKFNAVKKQESSVDNFFAKPDDKPKKGFWFYFVKVVVFLILLVVLALCIDIYGIYRMNWRDKISYQVAHILPLPAAKVNGKMIRLSDYLDDVSVLQTALVNQREGLAGQVMSPDNTQSVIDRLVLIKIIDEQLNKYGQEISDQDLNANLDSVIAQFNGRTEAESNVKKLYGINLNQFKNKVLRPLLSKNLLQSLIVKDDKLTINRDAQAKAQIVLALALKPGANFSELAKQYTEDEAGINTGGDLGFISKGGSTPEIEQILFSLPPNTVYDKIITNNVGFHIVMVENKLTDPSTGKESVKAKQILVKVDVDKYLRDLMASSKIVEYIK